MARNALHSPFAQQHASSSSNSRVSPFQAAATLGFDAADVEAGRMDRQYGPGLRQLYMDVFEPLGGAARSSSSNRNGRRDQDQQHVVRPALAVPTRVVVGHDLLSSSSSRPSNQIYSTQVFAVRTQSSLTSSASERQQVPAAHAGIHSRLRTAASLNNSGSSASGSGSSRTLRRLRRHSSSLLAATSATASSLWSSLAALGDRSSRILLCRSSPVSEGSSVEVAAAAVGVGVVRVVGGYSVESVNSDLQISPTRSPRMPQRLLTRSTAIRRSAARSPAVLIDVDATDSYDDLLALDQFNVKRAVRLSVLKNLPSRTPDEEDRQQQRHCHICLQPWLPPATAPGAGQQQSTASAAAAAATAAEGAQAGSSQQWSHHCMGQQQLPYPQQQWSQQQQLPQSPWVSSHLPPVLDGRLQLQLDRLQYVCWDGVLVSHALQPHHHHIVPAPTAARLLSDDAASPHALTWGHEGSAHHVAGGSSNGSSSRGSHMVDWLGPAAAGGPRQVGRSRAEPAGSVAGWGAPDAAAAVVDGSWSSRVAVGECRCGPSSTQGGCGPDSAAAAAAVLLIQRLPCGHEFCGCCIQTWLGEHTSCPVCRWSEWSEDDTWLININR